MPEESPTLEESVRDVLQRQSVLPPTPSDSLRESVRSAVEQQRGIFDGFFEDAKTFLNDDQIVQLEEMRERQRGQRGGRDRQREGRPPDRRGARDEGHNTAQIPSRLEEALDLCRQL